MIALFAHVIYLQQSMQEARYQADLAAQERRMNQELLDAIERANYGRDAIEVEARVIPEAPLLPR